MKPGKMRHVLLLEQAATTINAAGTPVQTWTTFATLRAERLEGVAEEAIAGAGAQDRETLAFRTWFIAGVTNALRLTFEGRAYNLKRVAVVENGRGLDLTCERIGGVP